LLNGTVSGILGLAWSTIAETQANPLWQTLANSNQFDTPEMSFYMTRFINDPSASDYEPGGVFTLGGTNTSLYTGDIEFLNMPVQTPSYWLLQMNTVTVQGKSVAITNSGIVSLAAIDTGTTLIGGPTADVAAIWAAVPGSQTVPSMSGFYSFPCSTNVKITLSFGGKAWSINPADMNIGQISSSQCVGGIFDLDAGSNVDSSNQGPVGQHLLTPPLLSQKKNVYAVYRASPPSIGFAQLSAAAGGSGPGSTSSGSGSGSSGNGALAGASVKMSTLVSGLAAAMTVVAGVVFVV
ncbi:hypothetical protein H0H93_012601, partial [Arthromyces matolae]